MIAEALFEAFGSDIEHDSSEFVVIIEVDL
jgi:hypothetical protein